MPEVAERGFDFPVGSGAANDHASPTCGGAKERSSVWWDQLDVLPDVAVAAD